MPFDCYTGSTDFDPQGHYNNCVGVLGLIPNITGPPPEPLTGLVWDSFAENVANVGNGCSIAYNALVAMGAAPRYPPSFLAILSSACAGGFQPGIGAMDGQMNNSPVVQSHMALFIQLLTELYDPYRVGYPPPQVPPGLVEPSELSDSEADLASKLDAFRADDAPMPQGPPQGAA